MVVVLHDAVRKLHSEPRSALRRRAANAVAVPEWIPEEFSQPQFRFSAIEQMVKAIHTQKYTLLVDATATTRTQMIKHSKLKPLQDLWYEMSVNHRVKYVDDLQQGRHIHDTP